MGGNPQQCLDAASTVLMNMLGLVCDPVGGLVESPCQNRNAAGVANALIAAELSLSGIRQLIPFDQMLDAMYAVGKRLPAELRETALGGCAATPAACAACGLCSGPNGGALHLFVQTHRKDGRDDWRLSAKCDKLNAEVLCAARAERQKK